MINCNWSRDQWSLLRLQNWRQFVRHYFDTLNHWFGLVCWCDLSIGIDVTKSSSAPNIIYFTHLKDNDWENYYHGFISLIFLPERIIIVNEKKPSIELQTFKWPKDNPSKKSLTTNLVKNVLFSSRFLLFLIAFSVNEKLNQQNIVKTSFESRLETLINNTSVRQCSFDLRSRQEKVSNFGKLSNKLDKKN